MAIHKLTDLKIRAKLREIQELSFSPKPKNALLGDGQGLYLSVTKTGTASWLFRYMDFGKAKSVGLGAYPATSLQRAREKAQALRDARATNVDPQAAKQEQEREYKLQQAKAKTFKTCAEEFIELSRPSWRNAKHAQQWQNTLLQYAYSFNNADEHFNDILRCHPDRRIDIVVPEATSTHFLARMEKVFGTAANQYNKIKVNGFDALKAKKVRLIAAKAGEVNLSELFAN